MWQYYRDGPNDNIAHSKSFQFEVEITGKSLDNDNKKSLSLKYLSNFWKTLERPLINCEINHNLTCIDRCVISSAT